MRETAVKDILRTVLAVALAVAVYSAAGAGAPALLAVFNAFSVFVLYFAIRRGEIFGAVLGTAAGLVQDAFSLGVFGVAGLTKTLLGFWAGFISRRIDVASFGRNILFTLALSVLEMILWTLLTAVVRPGSVNLQGGLVVLQPVITAVLVSGWLAFERRRARIRSLRGG
ncbi:MAG TPA: rod shape-determining protein MreD [Candidatus Aminicenantes bacterium]|nr:rod shape-determining protein MreD [Candidatus Aminicenantes bacterium]HRY65526.1 rod shape-determining protein MreD [Candidatus Aminicenantes bacterium]HRZ72586.1 rod shape-determining protein MreD [Candidatus Aminicenantes bacterium]